MTQKEQLHIEGGLFIVFEGGEGAGKTSVRDRLAQRLREVGFSVLTTREPGETEFGAQLRPILLDHTLRLDPFEEMCLFAADRHQHVRTVIRPALEAGQIVLCDRYTDSTDAYQGITQELRLLVHDMNSRAVSGCWPHRVYWLDVTPKTGLARIASARRTEDSKFDDAELEFHDAVRRRFERIWRERPDNVVRIDTDKLPIEQVTDEIYQDLQRHISRQSSNKEGASHVV